MHSNITDSISIRLSILIIAVMYVMISVCSIAYAQFPDASTTGITTAECPNWAATKTNTSGRTISTNGTTVSYEEITGQITINAANVTLDCVKINANGALYGVTCLTTNCTSLLIQDSEIYNTASTGVILKGSAAGRATARRIHAHTSVKDAMKIRGHANLYDSYVHIEATPGSHNDAIQIESGTNIDIVGNAIHGPFQEQTSAILAKSDFGSINNLRIAGNQLSGGSYILYLVNGGFGVPTNVIVANNEFVRNSWLHGDISSESSAASCLEWYGNVWDDASTRAVPTTASPQGSCAIGVFDPIGGGNPQAAPASFSPAPGSYQGSVQVTISTLETGADIRYTINGSTPTGSSTLYTAPLTFVATTTLKAIVIKAGEDNSVVTTGTYTITGSCTY